jgi:hypothetical protein
MQGQVLVFSCSIHFLGEFYSPVLVFTSYKFLFE